MKEHLKEMREETIEGNKIIAQFMGGEYLRNKDPFEDNLFREYYLFAKGVTRDEIWCGSQECATETPINGLYYDRYFYWIMPVVQKIKALLEDNDLYDKLKKEWGIITVALMTVEIKAIYLTVVNFIKQYNKLNQ